MIANRLKGRDTSVRAAGDGANGKRGSGNAKPQVPGSPAHPVTNHESFSHSVLFERANDYRAATAGLLHGRGHSDPTVKPHEQSKRPAFWFLERGAALRAPMMNKNV